MSLAAERLLADAAVRVLCHKQDTKAAADTRELQTTHPSGADAPTPTRALLNVHPIMHTA